ncbi:MAG: tail fiber domain-containing protein [Bacteroidales bacterium]|nr:tail fiber domain-containing protein [Bacteroidales bacterium]
MKTKLLLSTIFSISISSTFAQININSNGSLEMGKGNEIVIDANSDIKVEPSSSFNVLNGRDVVFHPVSTDDTDPGDLVFRNQLGNEIFRFWVFADTRMYMRGNHGGTGGIKMDLTTENVGIKAFPHSKSSLNIGAGIDGDYAIRAVGDCYTTGVWQPSDMRFKTNIRTIEGSLNKLSSISGRTYNYKSQDEIVSLYSHSKANTSNVSDTTIADESGMPRFSEGQQYGLVAQEIESVFPELTRQDEDGLYAINYEGFIPVLIEAIKELQVANEAQAIEIENLKKKA